MRLLPARISTKNWAGKKQLGRTRNCKLAKRTRLFIGAPSAEPQDNSSKSDDEDTRILEIESDLAALEN